MTPDIHSPLLLIVSSPSGAGKTTLCHKLLAEFPRIRFSVSHTTRHPRPNEVDGRDYHFVSQADFDQMVADERFIEWAHVHGNRYGTAHSEIQQAQNNDIDLIFDVDYQGAQQIKTAYPKAVGIFVLPPNIDELKRRLSSRGTETPQSLETRFKAAIDEIAQHALFDYLLVNDDLDTAYEHLRAIFLAERIRHHRTAHLAKSLLP
ncbi:MAG: guanylate kinase [Proteobacteria bacterium]|nr:guanylate kinase [Pseudomonadota bacterium]